MVAIVETLLLTLLDLLHVLKLIILDPIFALVRFLSLNDSKLKKYYNNKTVVITGASSGIGAALSKKIAKLGANIILIARNIDKLNDVANECRLLNPKNKYIVVTMDMEKYQELTETTINKSIAPLLLENGLSSTIDIVILNAGISSRGSVVDTEIKTFEKLMNTNFYGPVAFVKAVLPKMIKQTSESKANSCNITVISSVQGKLGISLRSSYAASKFAIQGFCESLRAEVISKRINVLVVSPSYVNTRLSLNAVNGDGSNYGKMDETTASGMDPMDLAANVVDSIYLKEHDVVYANLKSMLAINLKVQFPDLLVKILKQK